MMRIVAWGASFLIYAAAAASLAGPLTTMGTGGFTPAGGASCVVLEVDGTSKLLLEDGTGCIQLES